MEKKIEICVGTDRSKAIRARLSLLIIDGAAVLSEQFHSVAIRPGDDLALIRNAVETHLSKSFEVNKIPGSPWPKIPDDEWAEVEQVAAILHTPERVAKRIENDAKAAKQFQSPEIVKERK